MTLLPTNSIYNSTGNYSKLLELEKELNAIKNSVNLLNSEVITNDSDIRNSIAALQENYNGLFLTNNAFINTAEVNDLTGRNMDIDNFRANNFYAENVIVNRPIQNIALSTAHIDNIDVTSGNLYNVQLFNVTGGSFSNVVIDNSNFIDIDVVNAVIDNLKVNIAPDPITSSAVLGYDEFGRVIPITVSAAVVNFPNDADYIYTDVHGTATKGISSSIPEEGTNLIQTGAVLNMYNDVNNSFNDVSNSFNDVNNVFNEVNNFIDNSFNDINNVFNTVNNSFNDVNNVFNTVNNSIDNSFNDVNNELMNVQNNYNNLYNDYNNLLHSYEEQSAFIDRSTLNASVNNIQYPKNNITTLYFDPYTIDNTMYAYWPDSGWNYISLSNTHSYPGIYTAIITGKNTGNTVTSNEESCAIFRYYSGSSLIKCKDLSNVFRSCSNMQYVSSKVDGIVKQDTIIIPYGVENMANTFENCRSFNASIEIPSTIKDMTNTFQRCHNFNQPVIIPNSVINTAGMFNSCYNFNQPVIISNSVTDTSNMFNSCYNFNQPITIPNSVTDTSNMFYLCTNFNQPIVISNSVTNMAYMFGRCSNFNENVYIYSDTISNMHRMFEGRWVYSSEQEIHIPSTVPLSTSNFIYNCLVNNNTGHNWYGQIFNDL